MVVSHVVEACDVLQLEAAIRRHVPVARMPALFTHNCSIDKACASTSPSLDCRASMSLLGMLSSSASRGQSAPTSAAISGSLRLALTMLYSGMSTVAPIDER